MENLRCSAAVESGDTLNSFTSLTGSSESETAGRNARKRNNGFKERRKKPTEIGSGAKRGVRAGVQAEGDNQKVLTVRSRSSDADEKSLQEWVDKLLVQALAEDRKKEARERQSMV